ncbi:class I SAM-dependent methyltransferase [Ferrovum myxofaciens]|uniref:class I SAM-dependent methyltransferase n=1 Tax=Ferrovum myxofaciens TaxID=416213 RepID=UPI003EBFFFB2
MNDLKPEVVVEIGCGTEMLYGKWIETGGHADCWIIVEPAEEFSRIARESNLPNLHVIRNFFERAIPEIRNLMPRQPDLVICSSLLHEVPSAPALLSAIHEILGDHSLLHLNVPNSESFHRRLAKAMGLIADTKVLSARNVKLLQQRVYDLKNLKTDLKATGLEVTCEGGYLVKPFTHAQMEEITPLLGRKVLDGLYEMGKEIPELACEIYVEACRRNRE